MKAKISIVFFCLLMITLFGCSNSKFQTAYNSFRDSFVDGTQFLDPYEGSSDTDKTDRADLKKLEQVTKDMEVLVKTMQETASTKTEKERLSMAQDDYDALVDITNFKKDAGNSSTIDYTTLSVRIAVLETDRDIYLGRDGK